MASGHVWRLLLEGTFLIDVEQKADLSLALKDSDIVCSKSFRT
jgi:hypothetical protein